MKKSFAIACLAAATALPAAAQPAERPNLPVYRSGPWFVVRSVRDAGKVVACTGFYRANRHVQLSKDLLIIQTPEEVSGVAFAFDEERFPAPRPLTAGERDLKAIAFSGDDFAKLAKAHKVRIQAGTAQGTVRHELELDGLSGALANIEQGCPVPATARTAPVRGRHRS